MMGNKWYLVDLWRTILSTSYQGITNRFKGNIDLISYGLSVDIYLVAGVLIQWALFMFLTQWNPRNFAELWSYLFFSTGQAELSKLLDVITAEAVIIIHGTDYQAFVGNLFDNGLQFQDFILIHC